MKPNGEKELRFNLTARPNLSPFIPSFPPFTPSQRATVAQHESCWTEEVGNKRRYMMQFENTYFVCILAGDPRDSPCSPERKSDGCTFAIQRDVWPNRDEKNAAVPKHLRGKTMKRTFNLSLKKWQCCQSKHDWPTFVFLFGCDDSADWLLPPNCSHLLDWKKKYTTKS